MEHLSDYDFELPTHLIAQRPAAHRTDSRLLVLSKDMVSPKHAHFPHILEYLNPGDALVLNDTKVFKARLIGKREDTGGKVEMLLSRPNPDGTWLALAKASKSLKNQMRIVFGDLVCTVLGRDESELGAYIVQFDGDVTLYAQNNGEIPLPRYIERTPDDADEKRYQTVFANDNQALAVAAPTAGFHFDQDLLTQITAKGVHIAYVTLHVGPGTFFPIRDDDIENHKMHGEMWHISQHTADILNRVRKEKKRIVAVGTTSIRTLESALLEQAEFTQASGLTRIFIRPGFQFRAVDAFITNFHFPKTTLLLLVAAAIGKDRLLAAYKEAIQHSYRFFSYGDACYFDVKSESAL